MKNQDQKEPASDVRRANTRAGRRLEYFTLGWNLTEAAVAISAGILAGSISLIGFGADSLIESLSGAILLWRLQAHAVPETALSTAMFFLGFLILPIIDMVSQGSGSASAMRWETAPPTREFQISAI